MQLIISNEIPNPKQVFTPIIHYTASIDMVDSNFLPLNQSTSGVQQQRFNLTRNEAYKIVDLQTVWLSCGRQLTLALLLRGPSLTYDVLQIVRYYFRFVSLSQTDMNVT